MAITEADVKQQIVLEVGDVNPTTGDPATTPGQAGSDGIIWSRIDYLWTRYGAWDQVAAGLRELYCRRAAIRLVLGVLSPRRFDTTDTQAGASFRANQLWEHYLAMLEAVSAEIADALRAAATPGGGPSTGGASSPYQGALIAKRAPVPVRPGAPDPNALPYGGAPRVVPGAVIVPDDEVT